MLGNQAGRSGGRPAPPCRREVREDPVWGGEGVVATLLRLALLGPRWAVAPPARPCLPTAAGPEGGTGELGGGAAREGPGARPLTRGGQEKRGLRSPFEVSQKASSCWGCQNTGLPFDPKVCFFKLGNKGVLKV